MKAIADTGLIVAFGNRHDRFHDWVGSPFIKPRSAIGHES
jgi:hypothetical protein